METILINNIKEIQKAIPNLEKSLGLKIKLEGKKALVEGEPMEEYEARKILEAISFGFSAKQAMQLKDPEIAFKTINIKKFTRRANLKDVRARIIGKEGKVKRTLENLSRTSIIIKGNEVGIIGDAESTEEIITALASLIKGSKQSNVYSFLERMNAKRKALGE